MSKTVDGMCADCWGVKDPATAKRWLTRPRRKPLIDPFDLLWIVGAVVAFLLVAVFVAGQWI